MKQAAASETSTSLASLMQQVVQGLPAAAYICDTEGRINFYNQAARELWGGAPSVNARWCGAWKLYDLKGNQLAPESLAMSRLLNKDQATGETELIIERPDHSRRTVYSRPQPLFDDLGNLSGTVNILFDITEKKIAEENTARLAAIVESSVDAIISKTLEGIITSWNHSAQKLFGYTAEEMIGQPITFLIPPDRLEEETLIINRIRKGERVESFDTLRMTKDGRLIDISLTISPIRDPRGNIIGASKIARDITGARTLNKALEEKEERLRVALNAAQLGTWAWNPLTGELVWDDRTKELFGLPPVAEVDYSVFLQGLHPEDRERTVQQIEYLLNPASGGNYEIEYRTIGIQDKKFRWLKAKGKAYYNSQGQTYRFTGTLQDITIQKTAEEQLRLSEERLTIALDSARLGTWELNLQTREPLYSKRYLQILGYEEGANPNHDELLQNIYPEDQQLRDHAVKEALDTGLLDYEMRIIRKDHSLRWIRINGKVFYSDNNVPEKMLGTIMDITDQKNAFQALQASESRLNRLADAMPQLVWIADADGNITYYNNRIGEYANAKRNDTNGWAWQPMIHPEDLEITSQAWNMAMQGKQLYELEHRIQMKEGNYRWHLSRALAELDPEGNIQRWFGTATDIHERKLNEELREGILNSINSHIAVLDARGNIIIVNKAWNDFAISNGIHTVENVGIGINYLDILEKAEGECADEVPAARQGILDVMSGRIPFFNLEYPCHSPGEQRWFLLHVSPLTNLTGGVVISHTNITERRLSEKALRESEERFRFIANTAPVMIWMSGNDKFSDFFNTSWLRFTGRRLEQEIGEGWQEGVHPDDLENCITVYNHSFSKQQAFDIEYRLRRYDGDYRWIKDNAVPRYSPDGRFIGFISACMDIDDIKKMSQQKDDFLSVASHELKTPLTSIKAYAQLLSRTYEKANDAFLKNGLGKVENQVNKMTKLVTDFLNLSKIESDKFRLHPERFDISSLVAEIAADIQMVAINHTFILNRSQPVYVLADKEKISQVITNFLNNAVKYSPEEKDIQVTTQVNANWVTVSVADQGIGIKPDEHDKIFQRFYRSEFNNNISYSGFGIGLYISSEIIRRHQGKIGVISEVGNGAEFYFKLPVIE
ncbi:MAG TPA: PAS domain S-box protein [Chitinophagaceae bacterium]|nr:PAS domain S-box protein [Chitinophagaceae bacterium]